MRTTQTSLLALATAAFAASGVVAQESGDAETQAQTDTNQQMASDGQADVGRFGDIVALEGWALEDVAPDGWSASSLLDEDAIGPAGDDIGEVEDLIFDEDGGLVAIIAEVGGFWDIGDTHVSIPWEEVDYAGPGEGVCLPVTEETVDTYDLFGNPDILPREQMSEEIVAGVDDAMPPGRTWRVSELIGDYARLLSDGEWVNYGYVTDVLVQDGEVSATLVNASGTYGYGMYGYPSYAARNYGWNPADPYYDMPYDVDEIDGLQPVDRAQY